MPSRHNSLVGKPKGKSKSTGPGGKHSPGSEDKVDALAIPPRPHVIFDESFEQLRLTDVRLKKLLEESDQNRTPHPSQENSTTRLNRVAVRCEIPENERQKPTKRIAVLKRASPDATLAGQISTIPFGQPCPLVEKCTGKTYTPRDWHAAGLGPRVDHDGHVIEHSLLGDPLTFYRMALARGDIGLEQIPSGIKTQIIAEMEPPVPFFRKRLPSIPEHVIPGIHGCNVNQPEDLGLTAEEPVSQPGKPSPILSGDQAALQHWQKWLSRQKATQQRLAGIMQRNPADLAMNSGEDYYLVQLEREKIDRTMPLMNPGKGFRFQSEFWNQGTYVGPHHSGDICSSLTLRQKGVYGPPEYVKCPLSIKAEKGLVSPWSGTQLTRSNSYLTTRREELHPLLTSLVEHEPDMDVLEVIGCCPQQNRSKRPSGGYGLREDANQNQLTNRAVRGSIKYDKNQEFCPYPLDSVLEELCAGYNRPHISEDVVGPSLLIQGNVVRWLNEPTSRSAENLEIPIVFQSTDPRSSTEHVQLVNNGTAVIYYEWTVSAFMSSSSTIQPGEVMCMPILFKSTREGIFKESWRLDTKPVLHGGLPIIIRLHGIAVWEQKFQFHESKKIAPALEIAKEANYRAIYRLLNNIISFFEPTQRPITPPDPMSTEPGAFKLCNPQLCYCIGSGRFCLFLRFFYHHEVIQKLKKLYQELRERLTKQDTSLEKFRFDLPEQWNFSLNTLRKLIYAAEPEKMKSQAIASKREDELNKFFNHVNTLSFPPIHAPTSRSLRLYQIGYQHVLHTLCMLFSVCSRLRLFHGLSPLVASASKGKHTGKGIFPTTPLQKPVEIVNKTTEEEVAEALGSRRVSEASFDPKQNSESKLPVANLTPDIWRQKVTGIVYSRLQRMMDELFVAWQEVNDTKDLAPYCD
ncbi:hypothetical protein EG68_00504 [Paragonimus skrjabini miyazakii]|uniref:MYCBP-associated protein n=1 Tax=Paragonimus skrjabini miyazakii TaxID=59628 RepID=A0A8S9Z3V1_9TREM|nr:hypothetical protein EG68_00504 [Paragonimus skrjabini miyazakii]